MSVDDYLAATPERARKALENLRNTIKTIIPKAVEVISYKIPTFRYNEKMLVAFSASKNHCSFHLMSPSVMDAYREKLKPFRTTKATIHFTAAKPLPPALLKKLIKARLEENEKKGKN